MRWFWITAFLTSFMWLRSIHIFTPPSDRWIWMILVAVVAAGIGLRKTAVQTVDRRWLWMLIPLAVAFIADDGVIVNVEEMQPRDETTRHCAREPVRYALEMTQGWFAQRGLKAGSRIGGIPR